MADVFTKGPFSSYFLSLRDKLHVHSIPIGLREAVNQQSVIEAVTVHSQTKETTSDEYQTTEFFFGRMNTQTLQNMHSSKDWLTNYPKVVEYKHSTSYKFCSKHSAENKLKLPEPKQPDYTKIFLDRFYIRLNSSGRAVVLTDWSQVQILF